MLLGRKRFFHQWNCAARLPRREAGYRAQSAGAFRIALEWVGGGLREVKRCLTCGLVVLSLAAPIAELYVQRSTPEGPVPLGMTTTSTTRRRGRLLRRRRPGRKRGRRHDHDPGTGTADVAEELKTGVGEPRFGGGASEVVEPRRVSYAKRPECLFATGAAGSQAFALPHHQALLVPADGLDDFALSVNILQVGLRWHYFRSEVAKLVSRAEKTTAAIA
jgi:hypothetical protein